MRRLSVNLRRSAFFTIYKSFIRSHLDYSDILYDRPDNENFQNKAERSAIQGITRNFKRKTLWGVRITFTC